MVNQAPIAANDKYEIRGSQYLLPSVISNDFDPDMQDYVLFDVVVQFPAHGSLDFSDGPDLIYYRPESGYAGIDTFTYKITDNLAMRSAVATVTLRVIGDGENCGTGLCPSAQAV